MRSGWFRWPAQDWWEPDWSEGSEIVPFIVGNTGRRPSFITALLFNEVAKFKPIRHHLLSVRLLQVVQLLLNPCPTHRKRPERDLKSMVFSILTGNSFFIADQYAPELVVHIHHANGLESNHQRFFRFVDKQMMENKTESGKEMPKEAPLLFVQNFFQGKFSFGTRLADSALSLPRGGLPV